ncbi:MAG: hypothetical protein ACTHKQ_24850 [Mesorhizobium sp.]
MMGHREKMRGGDEYDALTGWKKLLKVFARPGLSRRAKQKFNRRVRKEAKAEAVRSVSD